MPASVLRRALIWATMAFLYVAVTMALAAGPEGALLIQMKDYIYEGNSPTARQYEAASQACMSRGGTLATDPTFLVQSKLLSFLRERAPQITEPLYYTGASAKPTAANPQKCRMKVPEHEIYEFGSKNCYYRWRFGFYDLLSILKEPGTPFFVGLYAEYGIYWNMFTQFYWMPARNGTPYPRGYYYILNTPDYARQRMYRLDTDATPIPDDSFPLSSYVIVCEVQDVITGNLAVPPSQPAMVKGWSDPTWAEKNWWVFYLIIALLILLVLLLILIFCCTTAKQESVQPLSSMVLREVNGRLHTNERVEEVVTRDNYVAKYVTPPPSQIADRGIDHHMEEGMMPFPAEIMLPQGPSDMPMQPLIFARSESMVYSDADSMVSSGDDE